MQLTEKNRNEILLALPELPAKEADRIAAISGSSVSTVYRLWNKIKNGDEVELNDITLAIAELAASNLKEAKKKHKRWLKAQKQLSAA
jgi:hypothetical protein